jgi:uncharacterized membrane protein YqjE
MKHTIRYDVDAQMSRASISQYLYTVHLRPKRISFALLPLVLIILLFIDFPYRDWAIIGVGVVIIFLIIAWVKTYFLMQAQGRDGLKLLSHPTITINLSDELIEYSSSTGTRRHEWAKIDHFCETKDFMIFQSGKIPLLILPKAPLTADAYTFIKGKTHSLKSPATH